MDIREFNQTLANEPLKSTTIDELISQLTEIKNKKGNLDIVFWDQTSSVHFNKPEDLYHLNNNKLWVGGMHVCGSNFQKHPEYRQ
jgi:hypothetical protein